MKKMNRFLEIRDELASYKDEADKIINSYRSEDAKARATYQDAVFEREHEAIVAKYQNKLDYERELAASAINRNLDKLQDALKAWVNMPVPADQLQLLTALRTVGVALSDGEATALRDGLGNGYFAARLLDQITGTKQANPLDEYIRFVQETRDEADFFLRRYAGDTMPLAIELLTEPQSQQALSVAAAGCSWRNSDSIIAIAALCWPADNPGDPVSLDPENENDKALIKALDALVGPVNADSMQSRLEMLLTKYPLLKAILTVSVYSGFLMMLPPDAA